jgi:sugar lactone lactonase YvrE
MRSRVIGGAIVGAALVGTGVALAASWPDRIDLPDGFRPEGIASGNGHELFVGSIRLGDVYRVDARTGEIAPAVDAPDGRAAIGLKVDEQGRIFVAGGPAGDGYVYDSETGAELAHFDFTSASSFVNDVALTRDAAYFTDSRASALYVVPMDLSGFSVLPLPDVPLGPGNNLNGIAATPDGSTLFAIRGGTFGELWRIDPKSGEAEEVTVDGELTAGDGILLEGRRTLYVVRNRLNEIAVVRLSSDLSSGEVVDTIDVPVPDNDVHAHTTVARFGSHLYLPNARFGVANQDSADYWITRVRR